MTLGHCPLTALLRMRLKRDISSPAGRRWHDISYWGLLLTACVVMYVLNTMTPLKEDDMAFSLIGRGAWHDIWLSQVDHFMTANGRFADVVATLFCAFLGKGLFNVCNALVFGLMAHLVTLLSARRRSLMVLAMFLALVGCCYPVPGQTMLWLAGSCNYLWAITASLLLVHYLQRRHDGPLGRGKAVLLFVAAFVAGNFNEATSFGFFGGLCLYYAINRGEFNRRVLIALAGYLAGILLIMASPGAWQRAAQGDLVVDLGMADLLSSRWHIFSEKVLRFYTPLGALVVGVVVLLWRGIGPLRRNVWTYIFLCLTCVMFALGVFNERAYATLTTVGFIIVAMALHELLSRWKWVRLAVFLSALALSAFAVVHAYGPVRKYKAYEEDVFNQLREAPRQAVLRESRFAGYSRFVNPLRFVSAESFLREDIYCAFFDKDNVQFVSDSVYDRYHLGRLLDGAVEKPFDCDRPDIVSAVLEFPDQDYVAVTLNVDSLPFTCQQATYILSPSGEGLSPDEVAFRRRYGLTTDRTSYGFYPLSYQGRLLLIFPPIDSNVERVEFPIDHLEPATLVTLKPRISDN